MSEVITFDTESALTTGNYIQSIDILSLVDEDDPILRRVTPDFDFNNPIEIGRAHV